MPGSLIRLSTSDRSATSVRIDRAVHQRSESPCSSFNFVDDLDSAPVSAPPARHRVDMTSDDLGLFDREVTPDGVMVERAHRRCLHDVESGQVPTGRASISSNHLHNGTWKSTISFISPTLSTSTRSNFKGEGVGLFEAEYRVEWQPRVRSNRPFGVDQSRESAGLSNLSHQDRTTAGLEGHQPATSHAFDHALVHPSREDIAQLHRRAVVSEHASLEHHPKIRDVNLVRAPPPDSCERDHDERSRQDHREHQSVPLNDAGVSRAHDYEGRSDYCEKHGTDDTSSDRRHRNHFHLAFAQNQLSTHDIQRKDSDQSRREWWPPNTAV